MVKMLDFDIVMNEFELQSRYYLHFHYNTIGKSLNLHILIAVGWIIPL